MQSQNEFYQNVLDALELAGKENNALSRKIASQEEEIKTLRGSLSGSGNYKALTQKLASAGVIDRLNQAYLETNVNDGNLPEFLDKLTGVIETPKTASAPASPYEISGVKVSTTTEKGDAALEACNKRLREIHGGK